MREDRIRIDDVVLDLRGRSWCVIEKKADGVEVQECTVRLSKRRKFIGYSLLQEVDEGVFQEMRTGYGS